MNVNLNGKTIRILHHSEVAQDMDVCRLVVETGSEGGFNTTYKQDGYDPMRWQLLSEEIPYLVNKRIDSLDHHCQYEFARVVS